MEILGDDRGRDQVQGWPTARVDDEVVLDLDGEAAPVRPEGPAAGRSRVPRAVSALLAPEALGLAGLVLAVTSTALPSQVSWAWITVSSQQEAIRTQTTTMGVSGVVALALGVAALLRLPPAPSPLARATGGAATILGLLVVAVAAYGRWQASNLPPGL
jgi:hypothetical protein